MGRLLLPGSLPHAGGVFKNGGAGPIYPQSLKKRVGRLKLLDKITRTGAGIPYSDHFVPKSNRPMKYPG
jgi:hypothetical protein